MPAFNHSRIILIPDADKAAANAAATVIAGEEQGDSFIKPLSADGLIPPTHWITQVRLTDACLTAFEAEAENFPGAIIADGDAPGVNQQQVITAAGLQTIEDW